MKIVNYLQAPAMYRFLVVVICSIFIAGCGPSKSLLEPETDWVFLAQGHANHLKENDAFNIRNKEKFASIRIYVYHRDVTIRSVKVVLINGDILTPALDSRIVAGERSRTIDLAADGRQLSKIVIRYKSDGKLFSQKALVQIAGLRPRSDMR